MAYNLPNGKFRTSKIDSFASYTQNQPFAIDLITSRDITFIKGTLAVNYTTDSSTAPTAVEDGIAKLVQNLALIYNGAVKPIQVLSLQQLNLYGQHLLNNKLRNDQPPTGTGETGTAYVDFIITPSLNPKDPEDPKYNIPGEAPGVNNIKLIGQWGNEANVWSGGANGTITSATVTIDQEAGWYFGPNLDQAKQALGVDPNGYVYMPLYNTATQQFDGAYSGLGLGIQFPTDVIVRKVFMIVKDANGNKSNTIVSDLAIKTADNTDLFGPVDFVQAQLVKDARLGINPITGCLLIDCVDDLRDPGYAYSMAGLEVTKANKLYLKYSTTAAGSIDFLFDCVKKVQVF